MSYLTKSKFKIAMECPTKLYYLGKKEYANQKAEDAFLKALAEGGFQVAELAKLYHPGGNLIDTLNDEKAIIETNQFLQNENVIIFEGAARYQNLFVRADILIKNGEQLQLIEIKSKSINANEKSPFMGKKGIKSDWKSYILDVAFQKYVLAWAYPNLKISSYLMLANKNAECPSDGLHQKFKISKDKNNRVKIVVSNHITDEDLSNEILCKINVDAEVNNIVNHERFDDRTFHQHINYLADCYLNDTKIKPKLGAICKKCEFNTTAGRKLNNLKSGFRECWSEASNFTKNDFNLPTVLDIWDFRKRDKLIKSGICKIRQINEEDINPKPDKKPGWSSSERRWLQVKKIKLNENTLELDHENLREEMQNWIFPLHLIDFETTMVAIPFNKGGHPYEGIAFQFSHHVLHADGRVEHVGQFINTQVGKNTNLEFVRSLKSNLENDQGSIFRYHHHENTYLNMILKQIQQSSFFIPDKEELITFIKSITKSPEDCKEQWKGKRCMLDLCELVKRFYYDPITNGSNSIKQVFPAILKRSSFLQNKYAKPIYGAEHGIRSLNFYNWQWVKDKNGEIIDPYQLLPKLFDDVDVSDEKIELLFDEEYLKEGGAASIAYSRMQFTEMSNLEREELTKALLKYCELDTLAMVMIIEAWQDMVKS